MPFLSDTKTEVSVKSLPSASIGEDLLRIALTISMRLKK